MKEPLTDRDYYRASKEIGCDVPSVKAVAEVESKTKAFYPNGFPVILFERHKFRKYTDGAYNNTHPNISGPAGNYGPGGQNQINKFNEAFALDPEAAMKSCSWGKFQIMGFNYAACGYESVGDFVDAMKESEAKQLDAFISFIKSANLGRYLISHNWAKFAEGYNGAGYEENNYDTKMEKSYNKYVKQGIDYSQFEDEPEELPKEDTNKPTETPKDSELKVGDDKPEWSEGSRPTNFNSQPVPENTPTVMGGATTWVTTVRAWYTSLGLSVTTVTTVLTGAVTNPLLIKVLLGVAGATLVAAGVYGIVYLIIRYLNNKQEREHSFELNKLQLQLAADKDKNNVHLVK